MKTATCIGCGCTAGHDFHWLRVDYTRENGVCSHCPEFALAWDYNHAFGPPHFDLVAHLRRQRIFSLATFGPGERAQQVADYLLKYGDRFRIPGDIEGWAELILLTLDCAWRAGHAPEDIALAIATKQARNELRIWPDWRTAEPGKAIEHVRKVGAGDTAGS
jgi:hypothetical protein